MMATKRTATQQRLGAVHKAVFGNGKPGESMLVRIDRIERKMCALERLSWAILIGVGTVVVKMTAVWLTAISGK